MATAVRGRQDAYQSGNDSGILMGSQPDAWERPCKSDELYPISFEAEDLSLTEPVAPVQVSRFNKSASALKNQAGRLITGGNFTLQFHVEDMAPWLQEILHSTNADNSPINIRRGTPGTGDNTTTFVTEHTIGTGDLTIVTASDANISPWKGDAAEGTLDTEYVEFVISDATATTDVDIYYEITGTIPSGTSTETITETIHLKAKSTTDEPKLANGLYYSRKKYYSITSINVASAPASSVTPGSANLTVNFTKFARRLPNLDLTGIHKWE